MIENSENTFTAYLGSEFQEKLMWQLLVEPEFTENILQNLSVDYFDNPNLKRLFIIILEYVHEYEKIPNLQNLSIHQAINKYKSPNNNIEEEALFSLIKRFQLWNEMILNKEMLHDGDVVQKTTNDFIKQQEYRKLGEYIISKTKTGEIKNKQILGAIEEKINNIICIGDQEDYGTEVFENIDNVLRKEFRETIPTGVSVIDALTGGGLGKGEIGIVLTPSGIGKTTLLTKIANTAYEESKNVLQIIFEDKIEQIQRKYFTIWSEVPLDEIDDNAEYVGEKVKNRVREFKKNGGRLIIKKFSQEDTTMLDIRNWIKRYEKKWGYKFELVVLDYLDCLDSHKKTKDRTEAELIIIKSFEAMAGDLNIPAWSAIQSNRSGFESEYLEAHQTGGSIKRIQKAHFFMSISKTPAQKEADLANIRIIKARFARDGQTFTDCVFDNNKMKIIIEDSRYVNSRAMKGLKKHTSEDIENINKLKNELKNKSSDIEIHKKINEHFDDKPNDEVNDDKPNDEVKNAFSNVLPKENNKIENIEELENKLENPDDLDEKESDIKKILKEKSKNQVIIKE